MPGLQEAFDRIGAAVEHHLEASHAAGSRPRGHRPRGDPRRRGPRDRRRGRRTPVRPETRFQIGSISKSFAGIVALQEVEAGRLDLHVSVNEILPWLELPEPFGPITLHHLMTHTAGLAIGTEDAPTLPGALWLARQYPPTTAPGERFWYSNDGWKIVGACLEQVTGHRRSTSCSPSGSSARSACATPSRASPSGVPDDRHRLRATRWDRPPQLRHPLSPADPHRVEHGRRVDRVRRARHGRVRAAAARARRRARRPGRPPRPRRDVRVLDRAAGRTTARAARTPTACGRRRSTACGGSRTPAAWSGYTAYLATVARRGPRARDPAERRRRQAGSVAASRSPRCAPSLAGDELPPSLGAAGPDRRSRTAAEYVGTLPGRRRPRARAPRRRRRPRPSRRARRRAPRARPPRAEPGDMFLVPHDALERFPLVFGRDGDGTVVEAFHGPTWFRGERVPGRSPDRASPRRSRARRALPQRRPVEPGAARPRRARAQLVLQWPYDGGRRAMRRAADPARGRVVRGGCRARPAPRPVPRRDRRRARRRRRVQRRPVVPLVRGVSPVRASGRRGRLLAGQPDRLAVGPDVELRRLVPERR